MEQHLLNSIVIKAKFFFVGIDADNDKYIDCFMNEIKEGQEGFKIKIEYLHGKGYSWEVYGFKMGNAVVQYLFDNPEQITSTPKEAFALYGNCPKCGDELFNSFNWGLHNPATCGQKKAVAISTEN